MDKTQRSEVIYRGRVQGVGFRYATRRVAMGYEVTGMVCNLPDGTVHLVAEGVPCEVDAFLAAVQEQLSVFIRETERKDGSGMRRYRDFSIRT